jgi:hypothetical protein
MNKTRRWTVDTDVVIQLYFANRSVTFAIGPRRAGSMSQSCADPFGRPPVQQRTESAGSEPTKSRSRLLVFTARLRRSLETWVPNYSSSP